MIWWDMLIMIGKMREKIIYAILGILLLILTSCGEDSEEMTALFNAVENGDYESAELILEKNPDLPLEECKAAEEKYDDGRLLELAVGDEKMCRILIDAGADVNSVSSEGDTYLHEMIEWQEQPEDVKQIELFLNKGADVNLKGDGEYNCTPLEFLISQPSMMIPGFDDTFNLLVNSGAEIKRKTFKNCLRNQSQFEYACKLLKIQMT